MSFCSFVWYKKKMELDQYLSNYVHHDESIWHFPKNHLVIKRFLSES